MMEDFLQHHVPDQQSHCAQLLPLAEFAINNAQHLTTKTPFKMMYDVCWCHLPCYSQHTLMLYNKQPQTGNQYREWHILGSS